MTHYRQPDKYLRRTIIVLSVIVLSAIVYFGYLIYDLFKSLGAL